MAGAKAATRGGQDGQGFAHGQKGFEDRHGDAMRVHILCWRFRRAASKQCLGALLASQTLCVVRERALRRVLDEFVVTYPPARYPSLSLSKRA